MNQGRGDGGGKGKKGTSNDLFDDGTFVGDDRDPGGGGKGGGAKKKNPT